MRITHQMLSRNYLSRMNTNLSSLTASNERMSSQRAFNKAYEDVSSAGKALKIRKLISDNERQLTTIRDAQGRAAAAEDALRSVSSILINTEDRAVEAMNGTMSAEDREKIATELEKLQEEVFQIMNVQFSDKFLFGASGNATGSAPFTKDNAGKLLYNGYYVDDLAKSPVNGKPAEYDEATGTYTNLKWNNDNYVDIGYGFRLGADGKVDPNTAFKDTYSGIESFGYGVQEDGTPKNAYSLLGSMVGHLRNNDTEALGNDLNGIKGSMEFLLTSITEVGSRVQTLENTGTRLEEQLVNLQETQNDLEGIDLSREIINNKDYEMSWMVTLQLGSKILPQTIFDFIR